MRGFTPIVANFSKLKLPLPVIHYGNLKIQLLLPISERDEIRVKREDDASQLTSQYWLEVPCPQAVPSDELHYLPSSL